MKRKKGFISIISLGVILFMTFGGFNIGDIQRVFADGQSVGEGEVKITNVNVNKTDVTAMERVGITAQFEGGANVKPGTQVTIDLPQRTTTLAGVYGINSTFQISGMTASGETVNDIATVHVVKDKVTLTFNQNVTKLPNGFKGSFTFYAEAQRAANQDNQNVETTTINVGGHLITIHIRPHATSGSSGIKPNPEPVDVPKDALSKVGWTGKSGMINWQLNGAVTSKATGTITITDTPNSEYKSTIIPSSFQLSVKKVGQKSHVYSYNELVKDGYLHLDANTGQWVLKLPATMLQNSHWGVYYQAKPDLLSDGQEYHNSASMTVNQNQIDQRAVIHVKNMGSGDITGNDSSSSSSIVIPSTTNSSTETTTKPTESTSTAVKPSTSTTNSSTETTTKPTESTNTAVKPSTSTTNGSTETTTKPTESTNTAVKPSTSTTNSSTETTTKPTENTSTAVKPSTSTTNSSTETTTKPTSTKSTVTMITSTTNFGGGNGGTTTTTTVTMNGPVVNNQYNSKSDHQSSAKELLPQTGAKRLTTIWTYVGVVLVIAAIIIAIVKYRNTR